VVVRRIGLADRFQLICGERRWRAHRRAGLETIRAIEWAASDHDAAVLALMENVQRVDLSHAEKVAALDQLAELAQGKGLRQTARQLRVAPGWLSRQLAARKDPVIFPALEAGRIGFGQATELLRAPGHARQRLLERLLEAGRPVPTATVRVWVEEARAREPGLRRRRRAIPGDDSGRGSEAAEGSEQNPYRALQAELESLGVPRSEDEVGALVELVARAHFLLTHAETDGVPTTAAVVKQTCVEMNCVMCGEQAALMRQTVGVVPRSKNTLRRVGRRIACGRCGGTLLPGERTQPYPYAWEVLY
jgi:ParB-like chromosome segregation protein Spo0J